MLLPYKELYRFHEVKGRMGSRACSDLDNENILNLISTKDGHFYGCFRVEGDEDLSPRNDFMIISSYTKLSVTGALGLSSLNRESILFGYRGVMNEQMFGSELQEHVDKLSKEGVNSDTPMEDLHQLVSDLLGGYTSKVARELLVGYSTPDIVGIKRSQLWVDLLTRFIDNKEYASSQIGSVIEHSLIAVKSDTDKSAPVLLLAKIERARHQGWLADLEGKRGCSIRLSGAVSALPPK